MNTKAIILFFGVIFFSFTVILQYGCKKEEEEFDQEKPTISILYPTDDSQFSNDQVITIRGDANDNFGIKEVQFLTDGTVVNTVESEPYEYSWEITGLTGDHTIKLKAYDNADNIGESDVITVTITDTNIDSTLKVYYPFNGNANDESGNGQNGTVHGAVLTTDRFGNENSAFSFDGGDDWIDCGIDPISNNDDVTFMSWCKSNISSNGYVLSTGSQTTSLGYSIWLGDSHTGSSQFWIARNTEAGRYDSYSISSFQVDIWYFITGVFDATANSLKVYIDGQLFDEYFQVAENLTNKFPDLHIGKLNNSFANPFNGNIDDIRIFNRVLSGQEILDLYHEGGWTGK